MAEMPALILSRSNHYHQQNLDKKRNENQIIEVTIDADRFYKSGTFDLGKDDRSKVPYQAFKSDIPKNDGETIIILVRTAHMEMLSMSRVLNRNTSNLVQKSWKGR